MRKDIDMAGVLEDARRTDKEVKLAAERELEFL